MIDLAERADLLLGIPVFRYYRECDLIIGRKVLQMALVDGFCISLSFRNKESLALHRGRLCLHQRFGVRPSGRCLGTITLQ